MPCASSSRRVKFGIRDEAIDERVDARAATAARRTAGRRRVAEPQRRRATPRARSQSSAGALRNAVIEVGHQDVRRPDPARDAQQIAADAEHFHAILATDSGVSRRRVNGYQYGPTDQLAPLASASGVIRKFSQPLTIAVRRRAARAGSASSASKVIRSSPPAMTIWPQQAMMRHGALAGGRLGGPASAR